MDILFDTLPGMERMPKKTLHRQMFATIAEVAASGAPVLVTDHNRPSAVIVSVDHFTDLVTRANCPGNPDRSAWRCPSCFRCVDLGEEAGLALTAEPEALCGACGSALVTDLERVAS